MEKSKAKHLALKFALLVLAFIFVKITPASAENKKVLKHPNLEKRFIVVDTDAELVENAIKEFAESTQSQEKSSEVKVKDLLAALKDGPGVGGGGFSYTRGAVKHISSSVEMTLRFLNSITNAEFHLLQSKWPHRFPSRTDLINKILDMHLSPTEQTYAKGVLGLEPLMADFRIMNESSKFVILQKKLFDTFNNELDSGAQASIARIILHEISHLYNIGIQNDEESFVLSTALADTIINFEKQSVHNASLLKVFKNRSKKIDLVVVSASAELNGQSKNDGIAVVTAVELDKSDTIAEPRYSLHLAGIILKGYDANQWMTVGQSICNKLSIKTKSGFKWKFEQEPSIDSTYGSYCIGYK